MTWDTNVDISNKEYCYVCKSWICFNLQLSLLFWNILQSFAKIYFCIQQEMNKLKLKKCMYQKKKKIEMYKIVCILFPF